MAFAVSPERRVGGNSKLGDMSEFWVVGGVLRDTPFEDFVEIGEEERYGPFWSFRDAEREWQRLSWNQTDASEAFYQIIEEPALH